MAKCDEGYLCEVCGRDVGEITESDLYLRYVLGEVDPEELHIAKERHITCNPALAQFIVDDGFPALRLAGPFDKNQLDSEFVAQREAIVTRAYRRLLEVVQAGLPIIEYPLPESRKQ